MHNLMFELSIDPIPEDERMNNTFLEQGDIPVSDWWCDAEDRDTLITNMDSYFDEESRKFVRMNTEKGTISFLPGFKREWLHHQYVAGHDLARKLAEMDEDEFNRHCTHYITCLGCIDEDPFGVYIYRSEGSYCETLNVFIRYNELDGTTWYVGGIVDYHA